MNSEMSVSIGDTACRILIATGMIQILWGLITGMPMGVVRLRGGEVPRYLTLAHMGGLMQGPLLMGLVFAVNFSALSAAWETFAAGSMAAASLMLVVKDTLNWWTGVGDEFAERPPGYYLGVILGPLYLIGAIVLGGGVAVAVFS